MGEYSRRGAGVVSGGGGPNALPASLAGMGVCSVRSTNSNAEATFIDLETLGVRGVVSPASVPTFPWPCVRARFELVFERVMGYCVQWGMSSSSAAIFFDMDL